MITDWGKKANELSAMTKKQIVVELKKVSPDGRGSTLDSKRTLISMYAWATHHLYTPDGMLKPAS